MTRREWQPLFLDALRNSANIRASCLAAHVGRTTVYRTRERDAKFAAAWDEAVTEAVETLEAEAWRRARTGTRRVVTHFYQGEACGQDVVQEYSDTLLIFLLKAHRPQMYRENSRMELTGANGGPILHVIESELDRDIDAFLAEMARREEAGAEGQTPAEAELVAMDTALAGTQTEGVS